MSEDMLARDKKGIFVRIPPEVHKWLRHESVEKDISVSAIVEEWIVDQYEKRRKEK